MSDCFIDYTVINSQPSVEAFEKLIKEMLLVFGSLESIDDLFYYGVFFKPQNYVNFKFNEDEIDFEVPSILTSVCTDYHEKLNFIQKTIGQIIRKEIVKPEWMKHIEMNMVCNDFGQAPSSFLVIDTKDEKYNKLAERLIEFLYSPNLTITMCKA